MKTNFHLVLFALPVIFTLCGARVCIHENTINQYSLARNPSMPCWGVTFETADAAVAVSYRLHAIGVVACNKIKLLYAQRIRSSTRKEIKHNMMYL